MKKTTTLIVTVCAVLMLAFSGFLVMMSKDNWSAKMSRTVNVENGVADPESMTVVFSVMKAGTYNLRFEWLIDGKEREIKEDEIGFITGLVLKSPEGKVLYATSTLSGEQNVLMDLEEGNYEYEYYLMPNKQSFTEFAQKYLSGTERAESTADQVNFDAMAKNGSWAVDYEFRAEKASRANVGTVAIIFTVLIGLSLIYIILDSYIRHAQTEQPRYDERQELERGRGFRYAFFTMLIYIGFLSCIDMVNMFPDLKATFLYVCGVFLGIAVYVVYCIWHESYFALNERPKSMMIIFSVIALMNVILSVISFRSGTMIENGQPSFHMYNFLCALLFLVLFIAIALKQFADGREDKRIDREDEKE